MPLLGHARVPEEPWRPGYRMWDLVGPRVGMSSNLSYSIADVGAGAPLLQHQDEELIVVLEGTLEARVGEEVHLVGPDHTLAVPRQVPHGFTVGGEGPARLLVFFPVPDPFSRTAYLEGSPPDPP